MMYKKIFLFALGAFATGALHAQTPKKNIVDEVIWIVGDSPILRSDVEEFRLANEEAGQVFTDPYGQIPEQLALQKLYINQAEIDSIEANEEQVIMAAEQMVNRGIQYAGSRENLEVQLHRSIAQIREMYKEQARTQQRVEGVQRKLTSHLKITPAEVRDFFTHLPQDSLPFVPTQVEVQIITATPQVSREEVERIEERLREFARRVNEGETEFSRLARLYSQDGSARNGGELGLSGRNQWVPEFANVAFTLNDPKKVSKIVRTEFGYHILQFIEKRGDKVNVRHILLKPEIKSEEYDKQLARLDSIVMDIRAGKFTFEDAALNLSDDKDSRNNYGIMSNMRNDQGVLVSRFEMKDLPQDIARQVEKMKVGEISPAFRMVDPKTGGEICAVIKLRNRIEAHRANLTDDFQMLKNIYTNKRQNEVLRKWIAEKVKTTYTRIHPEWRNHKFEYEGWIK